MKKITISILFILTSSQTIFAQLNVGTVVWVNDSTAVVYHDDALQNPYSDIKQNYGLFLVEVEGAVAHVKMNGKDVFIELKYLSNDRVKANAGNNRNTEIGGFMSLIILSIIGMTIWVAFDAYKRSNNIYMWPLGTFFLPIVVAPVYFAKRNLIEEETREGGTGWNILKNFALIWTAFMSMTLIASILITGGAMSEAASDAEIAGTAIGSSMGIMIISMMWFFPMVGALILGVFLKKSSHVEKSPEINEGQQI